MQILIDSHVLVWCLENSSKIGKLARKILENGDNAILVSTISLFELAQKQRAGKIDASVDFAYYCDEAGFESLSFDKYAATIYRSLPALHWRDPFDHMIISQAVCNNILLMSADKNILESKITGLKLISATD